MFYKAEPLTQTSTGPFSLFLTLLRLACLLLQHCGFHHCAIRCECIPRHLYASLFICASYMQFRRGRTSLIYTKSIILSSLWLCLLFPYSFHLTSRSLLTFYFGLINTSLSRHRVFPPPSPSSCHMAENIQYRGKKKTTQKAQSNTAGTAAAWSHSKTRHSRTVLSRVRL